MFRWPHENISLQHTTDAGLKWTILVLSLLIDSLHLLHHSFNLFNINGRDWASGAISAISSAYSNKESCWSSDAFA